jgi:hypothetical protein
MQALAHRAASALLFEDVHVYLCPPCLSTWLITLDTYAEVQPCIAMCISQQSIHPRTRPDHGVSGAYLRDHGALVLALFAVW